jgi:hypothetical protein
MSEEADLDQVAEVEPATVPRQTHANQLCPLCGVHPLDASTTVYACEHATWTAAEGEPFQLQSTED